MTATEALERRIDELCRENERLRGQVASLIGRSFRTADKMNCLNIENAKLRELVAGIGHLLFTLDVDYCAACQRDGVDHPCPAYTVDGGECLYKTDLRDLGVEDV